MSSWKRYSWADFDGFDLPWTFPSVRPLMPVASHLGRVDDPDDRRIAELLGFDPAHTYFTLLVREWRECAAGSRVLLGETEVAIENEMASVDTKHPLG